MPPRRPRWTWLMVLPMLIAALLLMHGLNAHAGGPHSSEAADIASVGAEHSHDDSASADDGHCIACLAGHVMAACVAIFTAIVGIGLIQRLVARSGLAITAMFVVGRIRGLVKPARPPDPAWVLLSVMRC